VRIVRNVPWWGLVSSAAAPVLLVGGWSGAARLQPQPVDPVGDDADLRGSRDLLVAVNPQPAHGGDGHRTAATPLGGFPGRIAKTITQAGASDG